MSAPQFRSCPWCLGVGTVPNADAPLVVNGTTLDGSRPRAATCETCEHVDTTHARPGTGECHGPAGSVGGWVPLHASCAHHARRR